MLLDTSACYLQLNKNAVIILNLTFVVPIDVIRDFTAFSTITVLC